MRLCIGGWSIFSSNVADYLFCLPPLYLNTQVMACFGKCKVQAVLGRIVQDNFELEMTLLVDILFLRCIGPGCFLLDVLYLNIEQKPFFLYISVVYHNFSILIFGNLLAFLPAFVTNLNALIASNFAKIWIYIAFNSYILLMTCFQNHKRCVDMAVITSRLIANLLFI